MPNHAAPEHQKAEVRCSVARTMQVLGDRWSILIVREVFRGRTRFSDFRSVLEIPSDVLSARLAVLVDSGILERRPYREPGARERFDYHFTPAGNDLLPVMGALTQWGDEHRPTGFGPSRLYRRASTGERVHVAFVTDDGDVVADDEIEIAPGPGEPDQTTKTVHPLAAVEATGPRAPVSRAD